MDRELLLRLIAQRLDGDVSEEDFESIPRGLALADEDGEDEDEDEDGPFDAEIAG